MTGTAPHADQQLRDRIAQAIASVTITIGPNSLALLKNGHTLGLTGGEIDAMALSALAEVQPELDRLALLDAGVQEREALLTEARDLLEPYGGHGDDWPAIAPAISTLLAEVARLRTELATARCGCYPHPADHETDCPRAAANGETPARDGWTLCSPEWLAAGGDCHNAPRRPAFDPQYSHEHPAAAPAATDPITKG